MKGDDFICFYSVLRFCPYRETDEFVNVGVLLTCPATGYFDFKTERKRYGRVARFFPELNSEVFRDSVTSLSHTLERYRSGMEPTQLRFKEETTHTRRVFEEVVKPRETILSFSEPRVISTKDPAKCLEKLFDAYVERRFAQHEEYQETVMRKALEETLRHHHLLQRFERNANVGDQRFHIRLPFVEFAADRNSARKAIKPLNLDKEEPTEILRHGDAWSSAVRRLRENQTAPKHLLFLVKKPKSGTERVEAYERLIGDFRKLDIRTTEDRNTVVEFARED